MVEIKCGDADRHKVRRAVEQLGGSVLEERFGEMFVGWVLTAAIENTAALVKTLRANCRQLFQIEQVTHESGT